MSSILNTARTLYAEDEAPTMRKAISMAARAHFSAAVHPTNIIGKTMGFGSFTHTMARRYIGEPEYEPGGVKNFYKSSLKDKKGKKSGSKKDSIIANEIENRQATDASKTEKVMLNKLSRVETNTSQTSSYLEKMLGLQAQQFEQQKDSAAFNEENQTERDRLFAALGAKMDGKAQVMGPTSPVTQATSLLGNLGTLGTAAIGGGVGGLAGGAIGGLAGLAMRSLPLVGLFTMIGNGLYEGYKKWQDGGKGTEILSAALNGFTFGLAKWVSDSINSLPSSKPGAGSWGGDDPFNIFTGIDDPARGYTSSGGVDPNVLKAYKNKQSAVPAGGVTGDISNLAMLARSPQASYNGDISDQDRREIKAAAIRNAPATPSAVPVSPAGGGGGGGGTVSTDGMRLLNAIAGSESNVTPGQGYGMINGRRGDVIKDFSDHPFGYTNLATGYGLAAGRYQFMPATWNEYKKKLGLKDFSPASQDKAAWALAKDRYAANTRGRNLEQDLKDPMMTGTIAQALNRTWTSLPGGREGNGQTSNFAARLNGSNPVMMAGTGSYDMVARAGAASSSGTLDVAGATQMASAMAAQTSAATTDMQVALNAPEAAGSTAITGGGAFMPTSGSGESSAAPGIQAATEGVDDIIAKILVAMGAVSQT